MGKPAPPLLEVALNGARDYPGVPRTPAALADAAHAAVVAGVRVIHLHPYDPTGHETLAAAPRCGGSGTTRSPSR